MPGRVMSRLGPVVPRLRPLLLALAACVLLLAPAAPRAASSVALPGTPVPGGFVGVDAGGPLFSDNVNLGRQFDLMVRTGVQTVRVVFNWASAQPYQSMSDVPIDKTGDFVDVGGVPTNFSSTDAIIGTAAARGLSVLPTVLFAPGWDLGTNRDGGAAPPAQPGPYAAYLTALVHRYGPHGSFWRTHHPKHPVRMWQIWNEPNIPAYWPQPFAKSYVSLLRAAHGAIKAADPRAKVVLGALTNRVWKYIGQIYKVHGARKLFDVVSVNGFTATPSGVITFLQLVRRAMNHLGDGSKPLLATELSWPSASGQPVHHGDWDTTQRGQARKVGQLLPLLAEHRASLNLLGFYYFTWVSQQQPSNHDDFNFAGLLNYDSSGRISTKPALSAYRAAALQLEGCRRKGRTATTCLH